ncbi:hypothetical protein RQP46_005410 [Phenoliferia psychrophenolica]
MIPPVVSTRSAWSLAEEAFTSGARCVQYTYGVKKNRKTIRVSFGKFRCILDYHNAAEQIQAARTLVRRLGQSPVLQNALSPAQWDVILDLPSLTNTTSPDGGNGGHGSCSIMRAILELDGSREVWMSDSVLSAYLAVLEARLNVVQLDGVCLVPAHIGRTITEQYAVHGSTHVAGEPHQDPVLRLFATVIASTNVRYVGIIVNEGNYHWFPALVDLWSLEVSFAGAMKSIDPSEFARQISFFLGRPLTPGLALPIADQTGSSGSCGIIGAGAFLTFFDDSATGWTLADRGPQRDLVLARILSRHLDPYPTPDTAAGDTTEGGTPFTSLPLPIGSPDILTIKALAQLQYELGQKAAAVDIDAEAAADDIDQMQFGDFELDNKLTFGTVEGAMATVLASELADTGELKKVTMCCSSHGIYQSKHAAGLDPDQRRKGKTIRTGCAAHVNITFNSGLGVWYFSTTSIAHNHARHNPEGFEQPGRPAPEQQAFIDQLSRFKSLKPHDKVTMLNDKFPDGHFTARQTTNLVQQSRLARKQAVDDHGGDAAALVKVLQEEKEADPRVQYRLLFEEGTQRLAGVVFSGGEMIATLRRFSDVLIADIAMNRNDAGIPLHTFVAINGDGVGENVVYALQPSQSQADHIRVLAIVQEWMGCNFRVLVTDGDAGLGSGFQTLTRGEAFHMLCMRHINKNVKRKLAARLGDEFLAFTTEFWSTYYSASVELFSRNFDTLCANYPTAELYLRDTLWVVKESWAWCYVWQHFAAGVRTTASVEVQQRFSKDEAGPTTSVSDLVRSLLRKSRDQAKDKLLRQAQRARQQHASPLNDLFAKPLGLLKKHAHFYAFARSYDEMRLSMFYTAEQADLPLDLDPSNLSESLRSASCAATHHPSLSELSRVLPSVLVDRSVEDDRALDTVQVSLPQMLQVAAEHHLDVRAYLCDCGMGTMQGLLCRHIYCLIASQKSRFPFHLSMLNSRWLLSSSPDITDTAVVTVGRNPAAAPPTLDPSTLRHNLLSNPLIPLRSDTPPPATTVLPSQIIHHEAQTGLQQLLSGNTGRWSLGAGRRVASEGSGFQEGTWALWTTSYISPQVVG